MSENFADLFEESLKTVDMVPGSIVTGVVIDLDKDWVTVHAGLKIFCHIAHHDIGRVFQNSLTQIRSSVGIKIECSGVILDQILIQLRGRGLHLLGWIGGAEHHAVRIRQLL